jgi:hypothetical protein
VDTPIIAFSASWRTAYFIGGAGVQRVLAVEDPLVVGRGRNPGTILIFLCHTVFREALNLLWGMITNLY